MSSANNPYSSLPAKSFWRPAVADRHFSEMEDVARIIPIDKGDRFATAGSCFAQHIGRNLRNSGANYLDFEPAPTYLSGSEAKRHGFSLYTCRYGNIYTVRQLKQLVQEAIGERLPREIVWEKDGRFFDALRPSVDPVGHDSAQRVLDLRSRHLDKIREMLRATDVFVFTLGLTEGWILSEDGTVFPTAPGTLCGKWDPSKYAFANFRYPDIMSDMIWFRAKLKEFNPNAKMILTVSPVPLTATAAGDHVLSATVYSKSTLRAVAGDIAQQFPDVFYFPSYELVAAHPTRGAFFNADLRTVNEFGVKFVMQSFFKCVGFGIPRDVDNSERGDSGVICDEERLDREFVAPKSD